MTTRPGPRVVIPCWPIGAAVAEGDELEMKIVRCRELQLAAVVLEERILVEVVGPRRLERHERRVVDARREAEQRALLRDRRQPQLKARRANPEPRRRMRDEHVVVAAVDGVEPEPRVKLARPVVLERLQEDDPVGLAQRVLHDSAAVSPSAECGTCADVLDLRDAVAEAHVAPRRELVAVERREPLHVDGVRDAALGLVQLLALLDVHVVEHAHRRDLLEADFPDVRRVDLPVGLAQMLHHEMDVPRPAEVEVDVREHLAVMEVRHRVGGGGR